MAKGVKFNPQLDIPDLSGRICLVTGASSGLGEAAVTAMAEHNPKKIYLAARSSTKAEAAIARIRSSSLSAKSANIEILDLDLASFRSIQAAAAKINTEAERLDVFQHNAGVAMIPHDLTQEGYEIQFGTNHMGHALLTQLLLPKLLATASLPGADVRVTILSSVAHKALAPKTGILFDELKTPMRSQGAHALYGHAKLAQTLFARQLAKEYPQLTVTSVDPGGVWTNIWSGEKGINSVLFNVVIRPFVYARTVSPEEGAKNQLWASFGKGVQSGSFYSPVGKLGGENELVKSDELCLKLWDWTNMELKTRGFIS